MPRRNGIPQSLTLLDIPDRDLLGIVEDIADNEGWVETAEVAERVFGTGGSEERRRHANRCVAVRFAWLRRYGVIERSDRPVAWRLTTAGERFLKGGKWTDRREQEIKGSLEADLMHLAMAVGERYRRADPVGQTMMRRAVSFYTGRR